MGGCYWTLWSALFALSYIYVQSPFPSGPARTCMHAVATDSIHTGTVQHILKRPSTHVKYHSALAYIIRPSLLICWI